MSRLFFLLLLLTSCSINEKKTTKGLTQFQGAVMTVPYKIDIGKKLDRSLQQKVEEILRRTFGEINSIYNKWNPDSDVSCINRADAGVPVIVPKELIQFLKKCDRFVKLSDGRFDPTVETIQGLWKKKLEEGLEPSLKELEKKRNAVGWDNLIIMDDCVIKKHKETAIDLSGIAKGYAVDLLVERLNAIGLLDVFVEWGGEIRASGKHPQGRNWAVFIPNLDDLNPDHAIAYVPLFNQSIATSGDYLQQWKVEKTTYFHLFDPKTLRPLESTEASIASASVVTKKCMDADALATMLLMCGTMEEAKALSKKIQIEYPDAAFWLLTRKQKDS